jgi:hypothetical protein
VNRELVEFFSTMIPIPQVGVQPSPIQQVAVSTVLDETPSVQDQNEVGAFHAREPVSAHEYRPAMEMGAEPVQNQPLGLGVHTG